MSILRDYICGFCGKPVELFDDEEKICPHCGEKKLKGTLSALNIKTGSKTTCRTIKPAGFAFQVKDNGELGNKARINSGEMLTINNGDKVIIATGDNPNMNILRKAARKMTGTETPPKSKQH